MPSQSDKSAQERLARVMAALERSEGERKALSKNLDRVTAALAEARSALERLSEELREKSERLARYDELLKGAAGGDVESLLEELRRKEQRIQQNTQIAKDIAELLRPSTLPRVEGVEIAARYNPTERVGADLYDVLDLGHRCVGFLVADAAGYGLQATLLAAMTKMAFKTHTAGELSPLAVMNRVNTEICDHTLDGQYLTAFFAVLDCQDLKLRYVNASLCPPVLFREGRCLLLDTEGMFLGMFEEPQYEEKQIQLKEGDKLLFYTDGFVQAIGDCGEPYRHRRVYDLLADSSDEDAETTVARLEDDLERFTAGADLDDDVTLLAVRILERPRNERVFVIPSDPEEIREIDEFIMNTLADKGYGERVLFGIKLAFEEAVINAMKHGNQNDKSKKVTVTFSVDDEQAMIRVADEGDGFNLEEVPDPTEEGNLEVDHGRGIFLMRAYMDEVTFNDKGNEVTMIKRAPWLADAEAEPSDRDESGEADAIPLVLEEADAEETEDLDEVVLVEEPSPPVLEPVEEEPLPVLEPAEEDLDEIQPLEDAEESADSEDARGGSASLSSKTAAPARDADES